MAIFQQPGERASADLYGVVSLAQLWWADTRSEALALIARRDFVDGIPRAENCTFDQDKSGRGYDCWLRYEGVPDGAQPEEMAVIEYSFDGSMEKERIETHPGFAALKEEFGWDEENKCFPLYAPQSAKGEGLPGPDSGARKQSELAGQDSWLVVGAEYSVSFVSRVVPPSAGSRVGLVVKRPPGIGEINISLGKRNFLKLAPRIVKRGNVAQVTMRYQMSGPNGIPDKVYSAGQLDSGGGDGE